MGRLQVTQEQLFDEIHLELVDDTPVVFEEETAAIAEGNGPAGNVAGQSVGRDIIVAEGDPLTQAEIEAVQDIPILQSLTEQREEA